MLFLVFCNANFEFDIKKLIWRSYIIAKVLLITSWVKLINKKEFAKPILDKDFETFVVHGTALKAEILIYLL